MPRPTAGVQSLRADRRLFLAADSGGVVEADDPRAATLLADAGSTIAAADVARYGLTAPHGVVQLRRLMDAKTGGKGRPR